MRIVIPAGSLEKGGGARFIYQLADALLDKGHIVEIAIPQQSMVEWPVRAKLTKIKELSPGLIPPGDFILPNFYTTVMAAWEAKTGQVVRLSLGYEPLWVPNAEQARQTYLIGVPVISISEWLRQLILQQTGVNSTVIPPGVNTSLLRSLPKQSPRSGRQTIMYIMRAKSHGYFWKGNDEFWQACTLLRSEMPNLDIIVVTPERDTVPLACQVFNSPSDAELARLYAIADVFVYASHFEGFGLPPLEAMAAGTAVVTTDCGGNRDYTQNGENCLVVPPNDGERLTSAIRYLLHHDHERQRIGATANQFAQTWTWQRTADRVEAYLLSLL